MSEELTPEAIQSYVLDASVILAWLQGEPGGAIIEPLLNIAVMSSVNWAEVLQKSIARGVEIEGMRADVEALGLQIKPFTTEAAELVAHLYRFCCKKCLDLVG